MVVDTIDDLAETATLPHLIVNTYCSKISLTGGISPKYYNRGEVRKGVIRAAMEIQREKLNIPRSDVNRTFYYATLMLEDEQFDHTRTPQERFEKVMDLMPYPKLGKSELIGELV